MRGQERKDQRQRSGPEITLVTEISASHPATPTACPAPAPPATSPVPRGLQPKEAEPRSLITGPSACKTLNSYNTQPSASTALRAQVRSGAPSQGRVQLPRSRTAGASGPRPGLELGSAAQRPLPAAPRAPRTRAGTGTQQGCLQRSKDSPAPDCPGPGKHHSAGTRGKRGAVQTRADPETRMTFQSEKSRRQVDCVPAA